jgi:hypothetical protein
LRVGGGLEFSGGKKFASKNKRSTRKIISGSRLLKSRQELAVLREIMRPAQTPNK